MRGYRVVRTVSVHVILLDPRIFIIQRQGEEKWGGGVGVNGHAYRYVLVLPAKRVFFFSSVKSLRDDSSSRRFSFGPSKRKPSVEPPA